ncbi:MAG: hypothetical protein SGI97_00110 [candidate division Zixibacteria bacterium]|nr:hypothetical protein [candidate division Zixibacteria bacterium]
MADSKASCANKFPSTSLRAGGFLGTTLHGGQARQSHVLFIVPHPNPLPLVGGGEQKDHTASGVVQDMEDSLATTALGKLINW